MITTLALAHGGLLLTLAGKAFRESLDAARRWRRGAAREGGDRPLVPGRARKKS